MTRQRLKHLKSLHFRRERGEELPLFTADGRLTLYGFNRIFSSITQFITTREFGLDPSQSCYYYSEWGAALINRASNSRKKARSNGGQFEFSVNFDNEHYGHWWWCHYSDLNCDQSPSLYWNALHVISILGDQVIDFQSPAYLDYRANEGYLNFITPVMFDRSVIKRFKDWSREKDDGLTVLGEWRPSHHKKHWMSPEIFADIPHYFDRIVDLFEQRIVCRELERFHGMDELDYASRDSYIWTNELTGS